MKMEKKLILDSGKNIINFLKFLLYFFSIHVMIFLIETLKLTETVYGYQLLQKM